MRCSARGSRPPRGSGSARCWRSASAARDATLVRGLDVAERRARLRVLALMTNVAAMNKTNLLELDESLRLGELAEERARAQGLSRCCYWALWARVVVHDVRGDRPKPSARRPMRSRSMPRLEPDRATSPAVCNFATVHADTDPERCIRLMTAAGGPLLERADQSWVSWLLMVLVPCAIAVGRIEDADRWARARPRWRRGCACPRAGARRALAGRGGACARRRPRGRRAGHRGGARPPPRLGSPIDALNAQLVAGRALAAAGDGDAGVALLQRVAADGGRHGAGRAATRPARELRRLGTRISARRRRAALRQRRADRARARRRRAGRPRQLEQAGGRDALPLREDDRAPPLAHLREARRALARRAGCPVRLAG